MGECKFWLNVDRTGDCWNWLGAVSTFGYGTTYVGKKQMMAHRVSWSLEHGEPPEGRKVRQACRNRLCVRPSHLELSIRSAGLAERFWAKVDKRGECWEWTGATTSCGYGSFRNGGKWKSSHRTAWELTNGPVPDGLHVLHSCDNPPCCNPAHLHLGTHSDNMAEMASRGRCSFQKGADNARR